MPSSHLQSRLVAASLLILVLCAVPLAAKKKPAGVDGVVGDETGVLLAGVRVIVSSPEDPEFRLETTTDEQGRFALEIEEPRASYLWRLEKEGYEPYFASLEVKGGERRAFEFKLVSHSGELFRKAEATKTYNAGVEAFNGGQLAVATERFQRAAELDPGMAAAQLGLARVALAQKDYAQLRQATDRLVAAKPDDLDAWELRFTAALGLADDALLDQCIVVLSRSERSAGLAVEVYNDGARAAQAGESERAITRLVQAARLDPQLAAAPSGLATLFYNRQEFEPALASADRLLELEPGSPHGLQMRYLALTALDRTAEAEQALAAYRAAAPEAASAQVLERADQLFHGGDPAAARKLAEEVLATSPDEPRAHYILGLCLLNGGDSAGAKRHLQRVLDLAPDSPEAADAREMLAYL